MEPEVTLVIREFDVQAGDIVVFTFPGRLSHMSADRMIEAGKRAFPDGVKIWILEEGGTVDSVLKGANGRGE